MSEFALNSIYPLLRQKFGTGQAVPATGIYQVSHGDHRLPHEVTLLAGEIFPRCARCKDAVQFEAVRHAAFIESDPGFRVIVYELPVLEEGRIPEAITG